MSDPQSKRRFIVETPAVIQFGDAEIAKLSEMFRNHLVDQKAEQMVVQADPKPQEKVKEVPVIVQSQEVAQAKEMSQTV